MEEEHHQGPQFQELSAALQSSAPKRRRWIMPFLIAVYAVSAGAALVLLWRGPSPEPAEHKRSLLMSRRLMLSQEPGVGWVTIHGAIYGSTYGRSWERGVEQWKRRIEMLGSRSDVKAIVLDINSPGGSVGAVQELSRAIQRVRQEKKKPVVALVGDVAASGGYWLAAVSDKVVAHPGSLVGSIGVIFETFNVQQLMAKIGVQTTPIKSGKMKDIGSPTRLMTPEERAVLQGLINDAYGQFLETVSKGRGIPLATLKPLADGRIFSGRQALPLRLVDVLGDSHDALMLAAKLGGISGKPRIVRESDSFESLMEMLDSKLTDYLRPEAAWLNMLQSLASSGGLEYRWRGF